jgi:hypothetical protein
MPTLSATLLVSPAMSHFLLEQSDSQKTLVSWSTARLAPNFWHASRQITMSSSTPTMVMICGVAKML